MNYHVIPILFPILSYLICIYNLSAGKINKLIIYQTSDIHAQITEENQGWLHLAQTIRNQRKDTKENSLLIDCGDTITGSIIGSISNGQAGVSLLNTLGYDAWIIGNHDLDFGFKTLQKISNYSNIDILAANLKNTKGKQFLKWKTYEKNGIKTAVIGLTSPHIYKWLWGKKKDGFSILPTLETIENLMPEIYKSEPDIIILAIHHGRFSPKRLEGFNIGKIAEKFPQIDLILGGHSHQTVPGEKCGRSTWYVETGCHAEALGWIEITVDTENKSVLEIKSKLINVNKDIKIDTDMKNIIKKWREKAEIFSQNKVGFAKEEIAPGKNKELFTPMSELFCKAICSTTGARIAFHGAVTKSAKFAGKITEQDIFDVIPYEDSVCTLELTQSQIESIIKEQFLKRDKGRFQSPFGINISINKNNDVSISIQKEKGLKKDQRYLCAFSSYALAGAGGRFPVLKKIALLKNTKGKDTGVTVRDSLRKYIRKNSPLDIKPVNRIYWEE